VGDVNTGDEVQYLGMDAVVIMKTINGVRVQYFMEGQAKVKFVAYSDIKHKE
jgi:hypothetical protein